MNEKLTPLYEEHKKLNARLAGFGGWLMPIQYKGIIAEHNWTRKNCSVFDICHMGEFIIKGNPLANNLEKIITLNISKMPLKTCKYGFILNEQGGVLDDVIVYKIKQDEFMLVVNAATTDDDFSYIQKHITSKELCSNISAKTCKLDLQGPGSADALKAIIGNDITKLNYYAFDYFMILGNKSIISRTGYTGELGYELYVGVDKVKELWNILLEDEQVKPAGLGARDTLRLEVCYPLYGQDIDEKHNPLEAGFAGFVDFGKDFIGRKALEKIKSNGPEKKMAFFLSESRRAPRHNYKIFDEANREIGIITSGSFSPSLSRGIGMGYINSKADNIGAQVILKDGDVCIKARIIEKPFYKDGTVRA